MFLDFKIAEKKIKNIISKNQFSDVLQEVVNFLYKNFDAYNWVGIYLVEENHLILGPWNGKQATEHTKIPIGSGVCGYAAQSGKTEVVADVSKDDRYLACFVTTLSEIVVPIKKDGDIIGEIDIDSDMPDAFNKKDEIFLEKIADMLGKHIC
jgi:putative methionine-R-sulfoxide reductase with GAF domain